MIKKVHRNGKSVSLSVTFCHAAHRLVSPRTDRSARHRNLRHLAVWQSLRLGEKSRVIRGRQTQPAPYLISPHQYSSASMIVITRLVTEGSAGSGEW